MELHNIQPKEVNTTYHNQNNRDSEYLKTLLNDAVQQEHLFIDLYNTARQDEVIQELFPNVEIEDYILGFDEGNYIIIDYEKFVLDYNVDLIQAMQQYLSILEKYVTIKQPKTQNLKLIGQNSKPELLPLLVKVAFQLNKKQVNTINEIVDHLDSVPETRFDMMPDFSKINDVLEDLQAIVDNYTDDDKIDDEDPSKTVNEVDTEQALEEIPEDDVFEDEEEDPQPTEEGSIYLLTPVTTVDKQLHYTGQTYIPSFTPLPYKLEYINERAVTQIGDDEYLPLFQKTTLVHIYKGPGEEDDRAKYREKLAVLFLRGVYGNEEDAIQLLGSDMVTEIRNKITEKNNAEQGWSLNIHEIPIYYYDQ